MTCACILRGAQAFGGALKYSASIRSRCVASGQGWIAYEVIGEAVVQFLRASESGRSVCTTSEIWIRCVRA